MRSVGHAQSDPELQSGSNELRCFDHTNRRPIFSQQRRDAAPAWLPVSHWLRATAGRWPSSGAALRRMPSLTH
jgi:hypothetical protein